VLYDISTTISYEYERAASAGRHLLRLSPANILPDTQRVITSRLSMTPEPDERIEHADFFGNWAVEAAYREAQEGVEFRLQARVLRRAREIGLDISPSIAELRQEIAEFRSLGRDAPHHFLGASPRVAPTPEMTAYARRQVTGKMSVRTAVGAINAALNADMEFDPEATTVDTSAPDAFAKRRGVCQDFSHIMIACLRGIGVPAGYVSGFLRTIPPPGKARLEGADAMHAWVMAWCGTEMGWLEIDPTNAVIVGADHVVVARGRDYSDVAPVKGVFRTSGEQSSKHSVDVVPLEQD